MKLLKSFLIALSFFAVLGLGALACVISCHYTYGPYIFIGSLVVIMLSYMTWDIHTNW